MKLICSIIITEYQARRYVKQQRNLDIRVG